MLLELVSGVGPEETATNAVCLVYTRVRMNGGTTICEKEANGMCLGHFSISEENHLKY